MADVFIDCEWIQGEYLTILGAYSPGQDRFQLYNETLTRNRFSRFLNLCCERSGDRCTLLFCHGPDIGRVMEKFHVKLKEDYYCINTIKAFNTFTQFRNKSLGHLEQYFEIEREHALSSLEITNLWDSGRPRDRRIVLDYNWEDCVNLWRVVNIMKSDYQVSRSDLKKIAME